MACCICLETPKKDNPIFLLDCGCREGWFHMVCENRWLSFQQGMVRCPTCRRDVPMMINYSFWIEAGEDQQRLWYCLGLLLCETVMSRIFDIAIAPYQTLAILLLPFIIPSTSNMTTFIYHVYFNKSLQFVVYVYTRSDYIFSLSMYILIGYLYVFLLYYLHICIYIRNRYNNIRVNPLLPYAISSSVIHREVLMTTKGIPLALK